MLVLSINKIKLFGPPNFEELEIEKDQRFYPRFSFSIDQLLTVEFLPICYLVPSPFEDRVSPVNRLGVKPSGIRLIQPVTDNSDCGSPGRPPLRCMLFLSLRLRHPAESDMTDLMFAFEKSDHMINKL
jgi:hypothetical protein